MKYLPDDFLKELEQVKKEKGILGDCEAFREIKKYSRKGRQIEKIFQFESIFNKK